MELFQLKLKRLAVANYRSIKRIELDRLDNLVWLAGTNNAGKSNVLDAFQFLSDAAVSFEHALAPRGGDLAELLHRKKPQLKMEFLFEFVLEAEKRGELIHRLFAANKHTTPDEALATEFLAALTLRVSVGRDQFTEELSTKNLGGEREFVVFSIKGTPKKTEIAGGQLEALCQNAKGELATEPVVPLAPGEPGQPYRLRLGRPESACGLAVSYELAEGVRRQFESLEWESPPSRTRAAESLQPSLAAEAANLPEVLQWVYNNRPGQFRKIEAQVQKLIPNLGRLHTPIVQKETTLALIDPRDEDLVFSMGEMSSGTRALVALVARVMLAPSGAWIFLEEPEYCLHPKAQARLADFLRAESRDKRIFGSTHSSVIAGACPVSSLFVVRRDADNATTAQAVTAGNAVAVLEELGVGASFGFECEAVVFVEQRDYVPVWEVWAKKHGFKIGVQFLACGGGDSLGYYANARLALSRFVHTTVMAVFGNGSTQDRKRITEHLQLGEGQIVTLDLPELEGCLLDAKAIRKAFPAISLSEGELEARLDPALVLLDQKKALRDLLAEFKIGDYDGELGGRIAGAMDKIPADVEQLFRKIEAQTKPYWEV